jgi:hypothetical protein
MRTLLRTGRKAHLVRIEGRGEVRFLVGGPSAKDRHDFADLPTATSWFLTVEQGDHAPRL